ncbi:unnamed protein product [Blepharisma stoltei]|uniref:Uncharacterized protein n=1 Tax=Blepharisma stoltei TaxID=1481888 RepID=A0AAU9IQV3_9CILI|nr:unnamed protein product [Blepharisma stoltei]
MEISPKLTNSLEFAESILLPNYKKYAKHWLANATKNEIKGLKIISYIIKCEGKKRFKRPSMKPRISDLRAAENDIRKESMRSHYDIEFGVEQLKHISGSAILRYRKLSELSFSTILTKEALIYLERWIQLRDSEEYQTLLLNCLRGIYSCIKIQQNLPVTQTQESFYWYSAEDQERVKQSNRNFVQTAPTFYKRSRRALSSINPGDITFEIPAYDRSMSKERKLSGLRGNGDFTSWISNLNTGKVSLYQDSFSTHFSPIRSGRKSDFNTSVIIKVVP